MGVSRRLVALRRLDRREGFTLIELLVVILIIGILLAIAAPAFLHQTQKASDSAAQQYLAIAYRSAAAAATDYDGAYGGPVHGAPQAATNMASAIQASEPELNVVTGSCPIDATSDPSHIVVDVAGAGGGELTLCNAHQDGDQHTVWTLTVVDHQLQPVTSTTSTGTGTDAPQVSDYPTVSNPGGSDSHVQVGDVLHVDPGSWTNDPGFSYQWQVSSDGGATWTNAPGDGATSTDYTVAPSDEGDDVRVVVTGSNQGGDRSVSSDPVGPVLPHTPVNDANNPPTVSAPNGSDHVQVGDQLGADPGQWSDSPTGYSYQWQTSPNGGTFTDIPGATSSTYTVAPADQDDYLRVVVQATNSGGTGSASSDVVGAVLPADPVNQTPPSFSGTPQAGQTLTADPGSWSDCQSCTYDYTWRTSPDGGTWTNVGGDAPTYGVQTSDVGKYFQVCVQATNAGGSSSVTCSSPSASIASPATPQNAALPTVSGTAQQGSTLTTSNGTWTSTDTLSYSYQWYRCTDNASTASCTLISGATASSYTAQGADAAQYLRAKVTATDTYSQSSSAFSPPTSSSVTASAPALSGSGATLSGNTTNPSPGNVLTASQTSWTTSAPGGYTLAYQWQRGGGASWSNISGATSSTYTVQAADGGSQLRVVETATNQGAGAQATSSTSGATGTVGGAPLASTGSYSSSGTSVYLYATVNPNYISTTAYFEVSGYGNYGSQSVGSGGSGVGINSGWLSFGDNVAVSYRVVAYNSVGTVYGSWQTAYTQHYCSYPGAWYSYGSSCPSPPPPSTISASIWISSYNYNVSTNPSTHNTVTQTNWSVSWSSSMTDYGQGGYIQYCEIDSGDGEWSNNGSSGSHSYSRADAGNTGGYHSTANVWCYLNSGASASASAGY